MLLGILTQLALHRWLPSFPFALAVFLEGMALQAMTKGQDGDFARSLRSWSFIDPHLLLFTFLPILLFGDAMAIDAHLLAQKAPHVLLLAGPHVPLARRVHGEAEERVSQLALEARARRRRGAPSTGVRP